MKRFKPYIRSGLSVMTQRHQEFIQHQLDEDTIHDLKVSIRRFTPVFNLLIAAWFIGWAKA